MCSSQLRPPRPKLPSPFRDSDSLFPPRRVPPQRLRGVKRLRGVAAFPGNKLLPTPLPNSPPPTPSSFLVETLCNN